MTEGEPKTDPVDPAHYHTGGIEPIEYINKNGLDFNEGCVIKYVTRHRRKNGAEDIRKAIQYCRFILRFQYDTSE